MLINTRFASFCQNISEASPLRLRLREVSRQSSKKRGFIPYRFAGQSGAGFTLIELLVVISILAILITMGLTSFASAQRKGRDAKRKSDIREIKNESAEEILERIKHFRENI